MMGRTELRKVFENKPFVTKKYVRDRMGYAEYNEIRQFFYGLGHIKNKYLTEDVIDKILETVTYED